MKQAIRPAISATIIGLSILGMINVYSDNADVEALARATVCSAQSGECAPESLQLSQMSRSPLSQEFRFYVSQGEAVTITCKRAALLLGDYSCAQD